MSDEADVAGIDFDPMSFVEDPDAGFCAKSPDGRVVYQNSRCREICGERRGKVCSDGCMEFLKEASASGATGASVIWSRKRMMGSNWHDILFLKGSRYFVTLLYPRGDAAEDGQKSLDQFDLTKREQEIAALMRKGFSNREISSMLLLSIATLKTHVNHIYRKIGMERRDWLRQQG